MDRYYRPFEDDAAADAPPGAPGEPAYDFQGFEIVSSDKIALTLPATAKGR